MINVKGKINSLEQYKVLAFFLIITSLMFSIFNLPSIAYMTLTVALVLLLSKRMLYAFKHVYKSIINVVISLITLFFIFFMLMLVVVYFYT